MAGLLTALRGAASILVCGRPGCDFGAGGPRPAPPRGAGSQREGLGAGGVPEGGGGVDMAPVMARGGPAMALQVDGPDSFETPHPAADTMDKVDPAELS